MWFTSAKQALYGGFSRIVERNTELERELAGERAKREVLERQLAISQGTQDWMMATVNELKQERAVLFERLLQTSIPVPHIGYDRGVPEYAQPPAPEVAATMPPNVPPEMAPEILRKLAVLGPKVQIPMRGPMNGAHQTPPPSMSDLGSISFEDMGNDAAAAEGIVHNDLGEAVHTR